MAITAIKRIINDSEFTVEVRNTENPRKFKNGGTVEPFSSLDVDMWIPWAPEYDDVAKHRIEVDVDDNKGYRIIFQCADVDGDFVRTPSRENGYPGVRVAGVSRVGGDRQLKISRRGKISLRRV